MLSYLRITNLAILEDVSLEPGPGFNVLTGETGAGKSIVVDAIGLLLGARGGPDLIRSGSERLTVEGQFDLSNRSDAGALLAAAGLDPGDAPGGELIVRRELPASGKGRAQINGKMVPLAALAGLGQELADLHGQHQHQSLLTAAGQRMALDLFCDGLELRGQVSQLHARVAALRQQRDALEAMQREREVRAELLRREIADVDAVSPEPKEEEELRRHEALLRHGAEVGRLASEAFGLISDDDESAIARLAGAADRVEKLSAFDPEAADLVERCREAGAAAAEVARGLTRYVERDDLDPERLEQVAARLAALQALARRHGGTVDEALRARDRARADLASLEGSAARRDEVAEELVRTEADLAQLARRLSERRRRAAPRLAAAAAAELRALAMEGTRLEVDVAPLSAGDAAAHGADAIQFLLAANKGEQLRPLARIASGGELSRLMLALRNATGGRADERLLIFDEVDSGIGGEVASAVGLRLSALARRQQIFCVTHLPQIAGCADRHFRVSKATEAGRTRAAVAQLDGSSRVEEIARMLGGEGAVTARRHAASLLVRSRRPLP